MFAEKTLIEVEETSVLLCSFLLAAMSLLLARSLCARLHHHHVRVVTPFGVTPAPQLAMQGESPGDGGGALPPELSRSLSSGSGTLEPRSLCLGVCLSCVPYFSIELRLGTYGSGSETASPAPG